MSKCTDCGINEAVEGEENCMECFNNNVVEISEFVPITEIEKVIATLGEASDACMKNSNWNKADAYNSAIHLLKELLPK